jgi:hypothetical protein
MLDWDLVELDSLVWSLRVDRLRSGSESDVVEDMDSPDWERRSFGAFPLRRVGFFSDTISSALDSPTA